MEEGTVNISEIIEKARAQLADRIAYACREDQENENSNELNKIINEMQ